MKIQSVRFCNFKGIDDLEIPFCGRSTVIFGINGAGKSSILHGIALVYADIIARITGSKKLVKFTYDDISYRKSIALLKAVFDLDGCEKSYQCTASRSRSKKNQTEGLKELAETFKQLYLDSGREAEDDSRKDNADMKNMPVFAYYGVNRLVLDAPVKISDKDHFTKLSAFDRAIESKIDFRNLFQWFRSQEDIENQKKVRISPDYEDRSLSAVKKAMLSMLEGFDDVHIERHPLAMKVKKDGKYLKINQLSDGEKCTIALFGDLARRMALANPGLDHPLNGQGVVLIDELDLHMHTSWQRKVMHVLRKTFPHIQFIVTTHSPQILGEMNHEFNLFYMIRDADNVILKHYKSFIGWDANVILEEVMGTPSVHAKIKEMLSEMYASISSRDYDRAEELADLIDEITDGYADGVARARVLISRGRRERNR